MIEFKGKFSILNDISPIIQEYFVENDGSKGDATNNLTIDELIFLRKLDLKYGDLLDEWIEDNKEIWRGDVVNAFRFLDFCVNIKYELENLTYKEHHRHHEYLEYLEKNNFTKLDFE